MDSFQSLIYIISISVIVLVGYIIMLFLWDSDIRFVKKFRKYIKRYQPQPKWSVKKYQSKSPIKAAAKQIDKLECLALRLEDDDFLCASIFELRDAMVKMVRLMKQGRKKKEFVRLINTYMPELILLLENYMYEKETEKDVVITDDITEQLDSIIYSAINRINELRI